MTIEQAKLLPKIQQAITLIGGITLNDTNLDVYAYFDFIEDESKTAETQITDNFVESNYAIQDHIAIRPKIYRLRGYVGEVIYTKPEYFLNWLLNLIPSSALSKISNIFKLGSSLSPIVGSYTKSAIQVVNQLNDSFDRYKKIIENFTGENELINKRQNVCNSILFYLMDNRIPISIKGLAFERKYGKEYNSQYYIQSIQAHQGSNRFQSDFEVVLKEIRIATTKVSDVKKVAETKANAIQSTDIINTGKASKIKAPTDTEKAFQKVTGISAAPKKSIGDKIYTACRIGLENIRINSQK